LFDKIAGDSHQKLVHQNKDPQSPMATITFQDSKLVILATIKKLGPRTTTVGNWMSQETITWVTITIYTLNSSTRLT
jgi:hypothetical protein